MNPSQESADLALDLERSFREPSVAFKARGHTLYEVRPCLDHVVGHHLLEWRDGYEGRTQCDCIRGSGEGRR